MVFLAVFCDHRVLRARDGRLLPRVQQLHSGRSAEDAGAHRAGLVLHAVLLDAARDDGRLQAGARRSRARHVFLIVRSPCARGRKRCVLITLALLVGFYFLIQGVGRCADGHRRLIFFCCRGSTGPGEVDPLRGPLYKSWLAAFVVVFLVLGYLGTEPTTWGQFATLLDRRASWVARCPSSISFLPPDALVHRATRPSRCPSG